MSTVNKIYILGIGYKPFSKREQQIIYNSEIIIISKRLLEVFERYEEFEAVKDKIILVKISDTVNFIRSKLPEQPITVLASGDSMFFGIGRMLVKEFGKDIVEIFPELSSIQLAFSKVKETWDDALLITVHGGTKAARKRKSGYEVRDIPKLLEKHSKIAVLTDKTNNPVEIAKNILNYPKYNYCTSLRIYVCERLGYPDERITAGTVDEIAAMSFLEPNVVIIKNLEPFSTDSSFGLKEEEIQYSRGLITKDEVRAVTIHKLRLLQKGVFWDVGAGSGSVSVEVAKMCPELRVFAIEKKKEQVNNVSKNKMKFDTENIEIVEGEAPEAMKDLPPPNRVFIGGSGGKLEEIVNCISEKMPSGIVIVNAVTLETLNNAIQYLEKNNFNLEISEVSVSRSKILGGRKHMNALNPVFVVIGERK